MMDAVLLPLAGGALIGVAAGALMILNGQIAGVSGILGGVLVRRPQTWRVTFVFGLIVGGLLSSLVYPTAFPAAALGALSPKAWAVLCGAGLLVGFGTRLGGGCTSGHGVCGVGRLSARSLVATATFMFTGVVTVVVARALGLS